MNSGKRHQGKGAIEILEEAVHALRIAPVGILACYYIGSLPFILALLYFWADMSRGGLAEGHCPAASMGLAVLFIWMKLWHAVFAQKVKAWICRERASRYPFRRIVHLIASQTLIQASGLVVLPLAALFAIPFGWCYAFYQNISVLDELEDDNARSLINRSWKQAKLWPGQNYILLTVFSLLGFIVFVNIAMTIFLIPQMLNKLLGIETMFAMSGLWILNTTFFAATCSITYLCMDPLVKTVYVLRCFYGASLQSGEDIKIELKSLMPHAKTLAAILVPVILVCSSVPLMAVEPVDAPAMHQALNNSAVTNYKVKGSRTTVILLQAVSADELNRSIEEVLNRREFAWRMPREKLQKEKHDKNGPLVWLMDWIVDTLKDLAETIGEWIEKVGKWLEKLLPDLDRDRESSDSGWMDSVRLLLFVLFAALVCVLGVVFIRAWLRKRESLAAVVVSPPVPASPDLTDEKVSALDLPVNRWLAVADDLMKKGSLRLALRALYLATLAHLSEHGFITIAKYKSNRDYEHELAGRAHEYKDLSHLFSINVMAFDMSWYGNHKVGPEKLKLFAQNQERIMSFVNR